MSGNGKRKVKTYFIWACLAVPALFIVICLTIGRMDADGAIHQTGLWSATFLLPALAATPFRRIFPKAMWPRKLMFHRRALGVTTFFYAAFHAVIYLQDKWGKGLILKEAQSPGLLTGWAAIGIFLIMALTSNNLAVKKLGPRWQALHRLVYWGTALVFVHWLLTSSETGAAYQFLGAVLVIEALRFVRGKA